MVKNVRWLYNKLGTVDISATGSNTISGGINAVQNNIDGKANASHTHGVGDLPVSNSFVNSTGYVPSSAVVYSLKNTISDLNIEITNIQDQLDPNKRYGSTQYNLLTATAADNFFSRFNHDNLYRDGDTALAVGDVLNLYHKGGGAVGNGYWYIAGFDLEHNQTAADGTVYDNGYGICLIPKSYTVYYSADDYWGYTDIGTSGGYYSSYMHKVTAQSAANSTTESIGSHLITRNVLLSNAVTDGRSSSYIWTTAKGTLMSGYQLTGTPASHRTKYDDGEANYKLPLFDHRTYVISSSDGIYFQYWLRGVYKNSYAYCVNKATTYPADTITTYKSVSTELDGCRPMIYVR